MNEKEEDMPKTTQATKKPPEETATEKKRLEKTILEKKRLNIELSPAAYTLLSRLATDSGKTSAEVLRTGLALYGMAQDAKNEGHGIGIIDGKEVLKEILLT